MVRFLVYPSVPFSGLLESTSPRSTGLHAVRVSDCLFSGALSLRLPRVTSLEDFLLRVVGGPDHAGEALKWEDFANENRNKKNKTNKKQFKTTDDHKNNNLNLFHPLLTISYNIISPSDQFQPPPWFTIFCGISFKESTLPTELRRFSSFSTDSFLDLFRIKQGSSFNIKPSSDWITAANDHQHWKKVKKNQRLKETLASSPIALYTLFERMHVSSCQCGRFQSTWWWHCHPNKPIQCKTHSGCTDSYDTRWAPTRYNWRYNPYKWPDELVTGISGIITLLVTSCNWYGGPPCMTP